MKNKHKKRELTVMRFRIEFLRRLESRAHAPTGGRPCDVPPRTASGAKRPIIFRSEMDYISRCILDYTNIETGGQLFGYWTEDGTPVVLFAIGPGANANHKPTFFNQDVNYLLTVGTELRNRFGLMHIGEWHSHHQLGLARPSGHDVDTMVSTIRDKRLSRFLLCIGNCNDRASSLNPFMCDDRTCEATSWNIVPQESPVRKPVYDYMGSILNDPQTREPSYMDGGTHTDRRPMYAQGYWMNGKGSGQLLNRMTLHVKRRHTGAAEVSVKLDESGRVHITSVDYGRCGRWEEDILFPEGFPRRAPVCRATGRAGTAVYQGPWGEGEDLYGMFINYYDSIIRNY